jgi:hypothetical protein
MTGMMNKQEGMTNQQQGDDRDNKQVMMNRGQWHGTDKHNDPTLATNMRQWGHFSYLFIFVLSTICHHCEHLLTGCLLISFI